MTSYVYAVTTASVGFDGGRVRISEGDTWTSDHPFVKAHPDFFSPIPPTLNGLRNHGDVVEQATRRPGEQRGTRRPSQG